MSDKISPSVSPIPHGVHLLTSLLVEERRLVSDRILLDVPDNIHLTLFAVHEAFDTDGTAVGDKPLFRRLHAAGCTTVITQGDQSVPI